MRGLLEMGKMVENDHNPGGKEIHVISKGRKNLNTNNKDIRTTKDKTEYRSNIGNNFMPYANQLETIDETQIKRKRKPRYKRLVNKINLQPKYKSDILRESQFERMITANRNRTKAKSKEIANKKRDDSLEWVGDKMVRNNVWPSPKKQGTIRVFTINMNGITYYNNYLEWEISMAFLMDMQVDIYGITETNLDFENKEVKHEFIQKAKYFDKYMKIAVSASKQKVGQTPFKMGGTATGINGGWSGRVEKSGSDKLGRWSYITVRAKKGKMINFITCYMPRKTAKKGGETTIYSQMELDVLQSMKKLKNPRKVLISDLKKLIEEENKKGNASILMGDVNDDLSNKEGEMRMFLEDLDMELSYLTRHGEESKLPATHDRGQNCIDMIAHSRTIPREAIKRAGFAPFYTNFFTDHRGIYIDIDTEIIFTRTRPNTTKSTYKRFTTTNTRKCEKYLQKLEELFEEARIFKKVIKLEIELKGIKERKKGRELKEIVKDCQNLSEKVTELMKCSEKNSGQIPYKDGFPSSPKIREMAFQVIRIKKYLRMISIGKIEENSDEKEKAKEDLRAAQLDLKEAQKNSYQLRHEHLMELAEKRSTQWNMKIEEALHIIIESEKSTNLHQKHRRFMKPGQFGTLRSLLVPRPVVGLKNNLKDPRTYTEVNDTDMINDLLLRRNYKHLLLSKASMFTRGSMLDKVGWYGEEDGINELLEGVIDCREVSKEYPEFGQEGEEFLRALRMKDNREEENNEPFTWTYGVKEFTDTFNHTKETTACGPSGLHMSHWKAACERKRIARVHAFLIWAAFEFGFTYKRWGQSWHCMIQKLKHPIIQKLRIVQLFEEDFNAGLKYLLGRRLMQHMNETDTHDPETFGSRTGKTAPEALLNLQLLFDHCRLWKTPVGCMFNDAVGCYDRIVPTICEISMIKKDAQEA